MKNPIDRFVERVNFEGPNGCWVWDAPCAPHGYGHFYLNRKKMLAHRAAWELAVGQIPQGLTLDHLCRNPSCICPDHLEAVTQRENVLRGNGLPAQHARKTHCPQGHPYDERNTKWFGRRRMCRACHKAYMKTYWERNPRGVQ
jgi:hypothetical protein